MRSLTLIMSICIFAMATDVVVPINSFKEVKQAWQPKIDSLLSAGDTVKFVNSSNSGVNVPFIGLFGGDDGKIYYKPLNGSLDSITIVNGGFHQIYVNTIYPESAGLGIRVKLLRE